MHVRCPHCQNAIEIVGENDLTEVVCPSCGSSFDLLPPTKSYTPDSASYSPKKQTIGHFQLLEEVGSGGFGSVWRAKDTELDRLVAVKIPRRDQVDPADAELFFREARAAAQLKHPGIVSVHEVGREDGTLYIVSDFVHGITLADRLTARSFAPREAAQLCAQIADALHHAHEQGVIHRDLKPSNVMLDADGQPHVLDFGLAKREAGEITMTVDGKVLGTPAYMSPEQARGQAHQADRRSDVYSLGVILYQLLTGELPFRGNARMLLMQIQHDEPPRPRKLNSTVPRDLETISLKCLEKEPRRRYATAQSLAEDLEKYLDGRPIAARPVSQIERAWRWCRRNPSMASLAGVVMLILLGLSVGGPLIALRESKLRRHANEQETLAKARANELRLKSVALAEQSQKLTVELERANLLSRQSTARYLAAESVSVGTQFPIRSILLAAEAVRTVHQHGEPVPAAAEEALRESLARVEGYRLGDHGAPVKACIWTDDGRKLITGAEDGTIRLWDLYSSDPSNSVTILRGHAGGIADLALSDDGRSLASVSSDKTVRVWDLGSAKPTESVRVLLKHTSHDNPVRFHPNGQALFTCDLDGTIRVWDLSATDPAASVKTLQGHQRLITRVAVTLDGMTLVTGSADRTVRVWDLNAEDVAATAKVLGGHQDAIVDLALSPDQRTLATVSTDKTVRVWDLAASNPSSTSKVLQGHTEPVSAIAFTPDGQSLVTGSRDGTTRVWSLSSVNPTPPRVLRGHESWVEALAITPDGRTLITGSGDATTRVWDLAADDPNAMVRVLRGHEDDIEKVVVSPGGRMIATMGRNPADPNHGDTSVRLWDVSANGAAGSTGVLFRQPIGPGLLAFGPGGTTLVTGSRQFFMRADDGEDVIRVWDLHAADPIATVRPLRGHSGVITSLTTTRDGQTLLTGSADKTARVWDLTAIDPETSSKVLAGHDASIGCVAISGDGRLAATGSADNTARVWDLTAVNPAETVKTLVGHTDGITHIAFTPDGRVVVTGSVDGTARVWDLSAKDPCASQRVLQGSIRCLEISADGRTLVTGSNDQTARVWDLAAVDPSASVRVLKGHDSFVYSLAISPNGRTLVTGVRSNFAYVWDLTDADPGKSMKVLRGHAHWITDVAISPDGSTAATGSADGTARLWDLQLADPSAAVRTLRGNQGIINCVAFAPDGGALITGGADGSVRVWEVQVDRLLQVASIAAGREISAEERTRYGLAGAATSNKPTPNFPYPWRLPRIPPPTDAAWHEAWSYGCDEVAHWYGASFHLDRLERFRPLNRSEREMRGAALLGLGHFDAAVKEFSAVLAEEPGRTRSVDLRGEGNIWLKDWKAVIPDIDALCAKPGSDPGLWSRCAIVHLAARDLEGYQRACQVLRDRWGQSKNVMDVSFVTFTCALNPAGVADAKWLLNRAQWVTDQSTTGHKVLIAAFCRNGEYAEALRAAEQFPSEPALRFWDYYFQAICHARLGQSDHARASYRNGLAAHRELPIAAPGSPVDWWYHIIADKLREEAAQAAEVEVVEAE